MVMSNDIGIDLGTASILVYIKGKGVVLKEPSVVAIDRDSSKIMAIGEEARLMIGRTPGNIVAVRPLRQGRHFRLHSYRENVKVFYHQGSREEDSQEAENQRVYPKRCNGGGEKGCGGRHVSGRSQVCFYY